MLMFIVVITAIARQSFGNLDNQGQIIGQNNQRRLFQVYNSDPYYNSASSTDSDGYPSSSSSSSYSHASASPRTLTDISNSQNQQSSGDQDSENIVAPTPEPHASYPAPDNAGQSSQYEVSIFSGPLQLLFSPESAIYYGQGDSLARSAFFEQTDESRGVNPSGISAFTQVPAGSSDGSIPQPVITDIITFPQEPQQQEAPINIINISMPINNWNSEPSTPPPTYLEQCPSQESAAFGCPYEIGADTFLDTLQQQTRSLYTDLLKSCTLLEIGLPMFSQPLLSPDQTDCCQKLKQYDTQLIKNCGCNYNFKCRQEFNLIGGSGGGRTGLENVLEYCSLAKYQAAPQCN